MTHDLGEPAPKRLRIAVLNRVFATTGGGAESYAIAVVEQLAQRHEVHVFAQDIDHDWPGVTYHRVSAPMRKPRWINQLWYAIATWLATRRGFDVVHSHENTWHGQVQTIHVNPVRHSLLHGLQGQRLARRWLKIVSSPRLLTYILLEAARFKPKPGREVAVASDNLRAEVLEVYPHAGPLLSTVTPGVALPELPTRAQREAARTALGLPQGVPLVLFVANDYVRKGLDTLLAALAQLQDDVHLAVVGNPAQIPSFFERVRALGIADRLHFLGAMKDVRPAYRAATLLAHPTLADTFAMAVLEAMAHGLPVIVSGAAWCGISALLRDGEDALLLQAPRNADALAVGIARLLSDPNLYTHLSTQARRFAEAHDWPRAAQAYEVLYLRSLTQRHLPKT